MQNLTTFLRYHADRRPEASAILYGEARITYRDLLDRVLRLSAAIERQHLLRCHSGVETPLGASESQWISSCSCRPSHASSTLRA